MIHKHETKTSVGQVVKITVCIDGIHIPVVTSQVAARRMGYTRRHVQNLCEWQKLIAIKISGIWFVHELECETYRQNVRDKHAV